MECVVKPIAAPIPGEHTSCAVGPVRRRSKSDYEQSCLRIPEPSHRSPPVLLIGEASYLFFRDLLPPLDETGALAARYNLFVQTAQAADMAAGRSACQLHPSLMTCFIFVRRGSISIFQKFQLWTPGTSRYSYSFPYSRSMSVKRLVAGRKVR